MTEQLWTSKEVAAYLRLNRATFMKFRHKAGFPQPVPWPGQPKWVPERVKEWADSQNS